MKQFFVLTFYWLHLNSKWYSETFPPSLLPLQDKSVTHSTHSLGQNKLMSANAWQEINTFSFLQHHQCYLSQLQTSSSIMSSWSHASHNFVKINQPLYNSIQKTLHGINSDIVRLQLLDILSRRWRVKNKFVINGQCPQWVTPRRTWYLWQ